MNTTDKIIKEAQEELAELVDKYFPKIKPQGINKGRGEAMVIVAQALIILAKALKQAEENTIKEVLSLIKDLDKQAEKGDLVGLQDLEEILFDWLSNLKEK